MEYKHIEYHYKLEKSDTVIVFIHGIQGSPLQLDYLIQMLNGLYSIENLLLPGHGKTAYDFRKSSMAQWQNYVDESVKKLQSEYKNIILVGHSMGCLLSVQSGISYPNQIRGLFLIAMPLNIHIKYSYIKNNLLAAFCKTDKNEIVAAARKGNSVSTSNPFEYVACIPRYIELLKKS
ncbi:MAG: alpha/beta hydrolase [Bacillota bacterium]|nr:alpha/beta hydrolase [Bacillota bacterium]